MEAHSGGAGNAQHAEHAVKCDSRCRASDRGKQLEASASLSVDAACSTASTAKLRSTLACSSARMVL